MMDELNVLRFELADRSLQIVIDPGCVAHWSKYRQTRIWHWEAGGLLFGPSIGADDGRIEIRAVSGPYSTDRRRCYFVELDHARCIDEIRAQFEKGLHFLGYWHTHPEAEPSISRVDRRAFIRNLRSAGIEIERMIAVLVGNADMDKSIAVYLVESARLEKLIKADDSGPVYCSI